MLRTSMFGAARCLCAYRDSSLERSIVNRLERQQTGTVLGTIRSAWPFRHSSSAIAMPAKPVDHSTSHPVNPPQVHCSFQWKLTRNPARNSDTSSKSGELYRHYKHVLLFAQLFLSFICSPCLFSHPCTRRSQEAR